MPVYSAIAAGIFCTPAYLLFSIVICFYIYLLRRINSYFQYVVIAVGPFLSMAAPIIYNYQLVANHALLVFLLLMNAVPAILFCRQECCMFWDEQIEKARLSGRSNVLENVSTRVDILFYELGIIAVFCVPMLAWLKWYGSYVP